MGTKAMTEKALEQGKGLLRLAPTWVPRSFCIPGRRIKLHPDDYYALGGARGGIDERWFSSTTPADNGPLTGPNEGLSQIVLEDNGKEEQFLLRDAVAELKGELIGEDIWKEHESWPMYSKFFDNKGPLPFHIHHADKHAALVGMKGKPEAYYFPPQVNNYGADFPHTFMGLKPGTTRDQLRACLENFSKGDNKITDLSVAYRLDVSTGWDIPPGVLHAPGSMCTYEPQKASDVFAMYQSLAGTTVVGEELLWKNSPEDKIGNYDWLLDMVDWELNLDPDFNKNRFTPPLPARPADQMKKEGYVENWITYKSDAFSAKELTVFPGKSVTIKDAGAYGFITMQGYGTANGNVVESPALIRYGQLTHDEYFVSIKTAKEGVKITNNSPTDPLVLLKHFGPRNPEKPKQ